MNENMRVCKIGQIGEIYIRTPFRTFGYYKDSELNSEKFIPNPFGKSCDDLIYKTGDLGKNREDGNVEFVGRIDRQIKLRGYRVELDEIEKVLLNFKEIKDVAVIEKIDPNNKQQYLCAFYNIKNIEITIDEIKNRLREVIPEYMIPLQFIKMDKLPFNNNGKIDYKKLEKAEITLKNHIEKPRTNLEKELINLWSEIFKIDEVGIKQRFFDVGGNSLTAMKLISSIYKNYNINLNLPSILDNPSIEILAKRIENSNKEKFISIECVENKEYYEISSAQKRIYLLSNIDKDDISHNITNGIIIKGQLDKLKIQNIFNKLIQRHSALRTSFIETNGDVFQKINIINEIEIEYYDAEKTNIDDIINKFVRSFDLSKAPLFRIALIKVSSNEHVLVTDMHHIISDGTSVVILMNEFLALYKGETLNDIKIEYKDFAAWQNNLFKSDEIEKLKEYWISEFSDNVPITNIPTDFIRTANRDFKGKVLKFTINTKNTEMLKNIANDNKTTINSVLFALYSILISKYCNEKEVVIGSLISGRRHFDINNVIGVFTNFLPIKNEISSDKTFLEVLEFTKNKLINAFENQDYPFDKICEYANCVKDNSRNPLFDTMLIYHNQTEYLSNEKIDGLSFCPYDFRKQISNLDLKLDIVENEKGELSCLLEYSTSLFTKEFSERMKGHFINIISQVICNPNKLIKDIDIITELEKQEIVFDFNNTANDRDNSKKLYELFEENVEKYPDNTAVIFEDKNITYKELNSKANKIARVLVSRGIKEDDFVAILMERTDLMMVAIMATWKAGGAYIPIDVNYPSERILNILNDSEASIVIKDSCDEILEEQYLGQVININGTINQKEDGNLNIKTKMNSIAYAIYTSGSTGKPKGAIVEHAGMMNHMQAKIDLLHLDSSSIIPQNASHCFDISVWQFFSALAVGGKTVIISNDDVLNLEKILLIIKQNNVNILEVVPSYLVELNEIIGKNQEYLNKLNYLLVTGEELKKKLIQNWFDIYPNIPIVNAYGPTEASDDITHNLIKEVPKTDRVSIGKPIQNLKIYILTEQMQMCPIGIVGELCVEGIGVGRGYINRSELTKKHFCESPFNKNVRMYKTGDLARWLPDGNIEFLGRKDNQVKVRGFRIELGEIETKIQKYYKVSQVAVIIKIDNNQEANLIAYIEPLEDFIVSDLRKYLRNELPEYMIPSSFINVKKMPTTFNGKIDRKALVNIKGEINTGVVYEEPKDEVERMLQKIYCEILGVDNVGRNDNFFELGGHSLRATNLVLRIYREASVEVPLSEVFKNSTIKDLAKYIKNVGKKLYKDITKVKENKYYEASSIQKRIFVLQQMDINSTAYNIPIAISFKGHVDVNRLKNTVKMLVKRHEALRTSFDIKDNEVVQIVDKNPNVDVKYVELKNQSLDEYLNKFVKPFDLSKGPLMRCELVKVNEDECVFIMDIHHIVADGSSMSILKNDFISLYEGNELSEVRVQYKDYSNWHNNILKMDYINQQEEYWLNEFKGLIPTLNLPTDYARPKISNNEGDIYLYNINRELSQNIYDFCNKTNTTLFMVMLEIFSIMLSKYSNQEEIIIGTVTAGRNHSDLEDTVGVFLNNLAIKCDVSKELYVGQYLTNIKTKVLNGYDNQECQIDKLIEKLKLNFDTGRKPLFDVMMILQNFEGANKSFNDITISNYMMKNKKSEYDITLYISEELDVLQLGFEYSTELFKLDTIKVRHVAN